MADYLEAYAAHFELPVRHGRQASIGCRAQGRPLPRSRPATGSSRPSTWSWRWPTTRRRASRRSPRDLDPDIVQLHSSDYRNPAQLRPGGVLHRRRRQLRRRDRARSWPAAATARGWRAATPATSRSASSGFLGRLVCSALCAAGRVPPGPDAEHADRAQGAAEDARAGRAADPRQAARTSPPPASSASRTWSRRAATAARARGRPRARRRQRHLVHRLPARLLLDRPAGLRRGRRAHHERGVVPASRACTSSACTSSTRCRRR